MGAQNGKMKPEPSRKITSPTAPWLPSDALGDTLWAPVALVRLIPPALCPVEPVVSPLGKFSSGYLYSPYFQHFQCSQVSITAEVLPSEPHTTAASMGRIRPWLTWLALAPLWNLSANFHDLTLTHCTSQNQTKVVDTKFSCQFTMSSDRLVPHLEQCLSAFLEEQEKTLP